MVFVVLVGILFAGTGVAKLAGVPVMRGLAEHLGFSYGSYRAIGALELAGTAGVCAGVIHPPLDVLSVVAATGLTLLMVGAVVAHRRVKDPVAHAAPAGVLGMAAAAIACLFVAM